MPQQASAWRFVTTSSGSSSCMAISSRMTSRSASTSSGVIAEEVIMSPSTSTASGRSTSRTRAWKQVYSLAVKALNSPPTASSDTEMSSAERSGVPLNSRCSRKCEAPASAGVSSREPTPTQTPIEAERTPGIDSVTTRSPPGRTVRRTVETTAPAVSVSTRSVSDSGGAGADDGVRERTRSMSTGPVPSACLRDVGISPRPSPRPSHRRRSPTSRRPRRPGSATACRGRRSRRSGPGASGPPRRRPRRRRRACRRPGRAAC